MPEIKYFITDEGVHRAKVVIHEEATAAVATRKGVFSTKRDNVAKLLKGMGYEQVTLEQLQAMNLEPPRKPDLLDHGLPDFPELNK